MIFINLIRIDLEYSIEERIFGSKFYIPVVKNTRITIKTVYDV